MAERTLLAHLIFQEESKLLNRNSTSPPLPDKASVEEIAQMLSADSAGKSDSDRAQDVADSLWSLHKDGFLAFEDTGRTAPFINLGFVGSFRPAAPVRTLNATRRQTVFDISSAKILLLRPLLLKRGDWNCWADTWCGVVAVVAQDAAEWVTQLYAQEKMIEEGLHSVDAAQLFKDRPKWMASALHPDTQNKTVNLPVLRQLMTGRKTSKGKKSPKKPSSLKRVNSVFDN